MSGARCQVLGGLAVGLGLAAFLGLTQPPRFAVPSPHDQESYKISVGVNLVILPVTVQERKGTFVSGLTKDNFQIYENGRPQKISLFHHEDVPVTVGLVVDNSASMGPKRSEVIAAAMAFAETSNPQDEIFVIHFNERVFLGLPGTMPLTGNVEQLRTALLRTGASGQTALYDAVASALEHLKKGTRDRKALVVFSDGGDNASRHNLGQILQMAEQSNAVIYTIGLFDQDDPDRNPGVLKRLAKITGGEAYLPESLDQVVGISKKIAGDLRNQYTLGYAPDLLSNGRHFRTVRVTVTAPGSARWHVRTRTGYLPPAGQQG